MPARAGQGGKLTHWKIISAIKKKTQLIIREEIFFGIEKRGGRFLLLEDSVARRAGICGSVYGFCITTHERRSLRVS